MCRVHAPLLILLTLRSLFSAGNGTNVTFSCPEYQEFFRGSCFESVSLQHSFVSAHAWCEQRGGHLAFIPDEETQCFVESHLDPKQDTWIGAASSGSGEGPLSWLDSSPITYSNWLSSPPPGAACVHIQRHSDFQWVATSDCNKTLPFICQFERGRSIICASHNATLQCDSGQVLMIDGGFYGRRNVHDCRPGQLKVTTATQLWCSWVDVAESLKAHCQGRRVCKVADIVDSLGEPCPQLGSYLSLEYHCKKGLTLSLTNEVASVFDDVTIGVRWLLDWRREDVSCKLQTGDGHVINLENPSGSDSNVVHKYSHPGTFAVTVDCIGADVHVSAQKIIVIQELVRMFGVITCYAGELSFRGTNCTALFGEQFQIQISVNAGSHVTYTIQSDEMLLSGLSVVRGDVPQNITVTPEIVKHLGPGCHQLTLYASNRVTFPPQFTHVQMCVLEKVAGLRASVLTERKDSGIAVAVTIEHGAPVLLLFTVMKQKSSFSETRGMNTRMGIFHLGHWKEGYVHMKIRAWNIFSYLEVVVEKSSTCGADSLRYLRVARSQPSLKIIADPSNSVNNKRKIELSVKNANTFTGSGYKKKWKCTFPCKCQGEFEEKTYTITENCLPNPFQYFKYHFNVIDVRNNDVVQTKSICITLTPKEYKGLIKLTCTGCKQNNWDNDAKFQLSCERSQCTNLKWYTDYNRDNSQLTSETSSCYEKANKRPLVKVQDGGTQYTMSSNNLKEANEQGRSVKVYVIHEGNNPVYKSYTIETASSKEKTEPASSSENSETTVTKATTTTTGGPAVIPVGTSGAAVAVTAVTTGELSSPPTPNGNVDLLQCTISPQRGSIFDTFNFTCNTRVPCPKCQYCFTTTEGKHLRCSNNSTVTSVFLPVGESSSNYRLIIIATARNGDIEENASITTQVKDTPTDSDSGAGLGSSVGKVVDQLKKQGLLSGETVGPIFTSVSNTLNGQSDESTKDERQKLREQMLDIMVNTIKTVPATTPHGVRVTAQALATVVQTGDELSPSAQEEASSLLKNLSSSLLHMEGVTEAEVLSAAGTIVEGASNILDYSSNANVSDALLDALDNTQSALLKYKKTNEGPTVISQTHIRVLVNRVTPEILHTKAMEFPNCVCPAFSLPKLPSETLPSNESVDVRMLSLNKNPFSWNKRGNISGLVGALSLTTQGGSDIPVENLNENIEILLPRPMETQVNTAVLDLGNYSTTAIDLPSADSTLVLKMVPSVDPLNFKLYLGYLDYPTDNNFVAMTEMPLKGTTEEERYTWILEPEKLKGNTGQHYFVVRPIVGPGIKSINASLSVTSITTACKFWNESNSDWSSHGCKVGVKTTHSVTQCLCNHLTFFGSSFFVTPNLVDPSRTTELFATFAENPVVVCFVGALFGAYLLAVVWARRKDIQDVAKVNVTVLEDNNPMDEYRYLLSVGTGHRRGASTSSQVTITLLGAEGNSEPHHLADPKKSVFDRGAVDLFLLTAPFSLGDLHGIRLWHNNSGSHPDWYVGNIMVQDLQTEQKWYFLCNSWLALDIGDCSLDKVFPVSSEMDLKRFSNLFFMKTVKDFSDGHLWFSVISRPANSSFTSVQRVSCCFSLLLCTMLTSIMFYGIPTDPSEQTMDLGHFEFTWQQFKIGVQSSLIMFPVNILIVSIFRNTRPWEPCCCKRKKEKRDILEQASFSQTAVKSANENVTFETVVTDITRIAHLVSKTVKSNVPCTEFGPGQQMDINAVLTVVEDFIRQGNQSSNSSQDKLQPGQNTAGLQPSEDVVGMHPALEGIEKKSNKTRYMYQQLCHIDKELSLLGPSDFHSPHSHSQALQQVQRMKGLLEDPIFKCGFVNPDEPAQKKLRPADSSDSDGRGKKMTCCHGGFPWWFVFIGWLLVIATSVVSGYFTMLYGLKYGKERSVSWLVSMVVSFFQSLLVIQPLKVVGLAIFFALVIKKVDEEDYRNVAFVRSDSTQGDCKDKQAARQNGSVYKPPAPADIEKMRRNKVLEQKAFALLKEIFTYIGFMWMLLLVAYSQRDPNAFFLNQHIQKSFSNNISGSMSLNDVLTWANSSLLRNLFGKYPGFITDGNSKLVGSARLRQLRVKKDSCQIASSVLHLVPDCEAPYARDVEDMGSYEPGWNQSLETNCTSVSSPWRYQTEAQLRSHPVWGRMGLYQGGGFVVELGPSKQNASSTLESLFRNRWLDSHTRAIFVEFTVYNANVNLFCVVTLLFESAAVGAFQFISELQSVRLYHSTAGLHIFVVAAEIIYLLFILYYMFLQGKLMKQQRWAYFRSKWNLLELTIILLSWTAVAVFTKRTLIGRHNMNYYQNHKDQFANFYDTASADSLLQYLIAFLVLLSTSKLWHLFRLNSKMNIFTATLERAWNDMSGFLLITGIMLVAYSIASNLIYGWKTPAYRTFGNALMTIISLQIGIFDYDEVLNGNPVLGGLLFGSCIVFMTFVVLNLLLSVILVAFNLEQVHHQPSDEEEIVSLLLKKICSVFGIRHATGKENPLA